MNLRYRPSAVERAAKAVKTAMRDRDRARILLAEARAAHTAAEDALSKAEAALDREVSDLINRQEPAR